MLGLLSTAQPAQAVLRVATERGEQSYPPLSNRTAPEQSLAGGCEWGRQGHAAAAASATRGQLGPGRARQGQRSAWWGGGGGSAGR